MSCKVQQSVCSDCVTYVKSRIKFNTFNTFNNVKQNENEIKGKELFELSLTFTEGDEEKQFSVTMKAKKDGKETSLDLFDSDFLEMSYNGVKMVFSQITYLYVKNLHDTGRMSDEEYNAIMAHAGQKPQGKAKSEE